MRRVLRGQVSRGKVRGARGRGIAAGAILLAAAWILSAASARAFEYVLGDALFPYSTQAQPAKGASYVDPTFHTTVTRVTRSSSEHRGWGTTTGYSTWNPLSSDGRHLLLMKLADLSTAGGYVLYDASTFSYLRTLRTLEWWNGQDPEPRWDRSGAFPNRLYYRKNLQLRYFDVVTGKDGLVRDFARDFPGFPSSRYAIWNGEEGSPSLNGRYWAFMLGSASVDIAQVFVYDQLTDAVVGRRQVSGKSVNNVMMSPSGNYVYVAYDWTGKGGEYDGPKVYKRDFSSYVKVASGIPHLNFAYSRQGNEVCFYMDQDHVAFSRLDTGAKFLLYYQGDLGWDGSNLLHAAGSPTKKGWGFLSTYSPNNAFWDYNQIFAIELDETKVRGGAAPPRIWRVSFTQNIIGPQYYYQQPNLQMDQDGTRLWWGANWRNVDGPPEVYQILLPATWWEDLSGAAGAPVITTTATLPAATAGRPYSLVLSASHGTGPYRWNATGLPPGLAVDPSSGTISGTAAEGAAGVYGVLVSASGGGVTGSKHFTLSVVGNPPE